MRRRNRLGRRRKHWEQLFVVGGETRRSRHWNGYQERGRVGRNAAVGGVKESLDGERICRGSRGYQKGREAKGEENSCQGHCWHCCFDYPDSRQRTIRQRVTLACCCFVVAAAVVVVVVDDDAD